MEHGYVNLFRVSVFDICRTHIHLRHAPDTLYTRRRQVFDIFKTIEYQIAIIEKN